MALWLSKRAPIGEWGGIQFRLILAQQESKSQLHYAMLARTGPLGEPDDVFILLPDDGPRDRFLASM
jgi:hypothetical protein